MSLGYLKALLLLSISTLGFVGALYEFRFDTFQQVKGDTETLIEFNVRLLGRQRLMNGTIKCHVDMDNEFEWNIGIDQYINGDWKPFPQSLQLKTCSFFKNFYGQYWESSFVDSNMPKGKDACPFRKGEYYLRNIAMRTDNWRRLGRPGLNRCHLIVSKNNITCGGFVGVAFLSEDST